MVEPGMQSRSELAGDLRRAELADFLRRRRAELTTDMVGLPATRRRRTPGLRREEVAELADVSAALYAWLEQGRDVPISRRTIEAIATALRFSPSEKDHVYSLVTHVNTELNEQVQPGLERLVTSLRTHPVFVLDHKWDVMLYNRAADVTFDLTAYGVMHMNLLQATFEGAKSLFVNWREVAASIVELFRYDFALYSNEPGTLAIVEKLRAADADFAAIWDEHRVRRSPSAQRVLQHPVAGRLAFEPSIYAVTESPGLRCMIYTPADDETIRKIGALVDTAAPVDTAV